MAGASDLGGQLSQLTQMKEILGQLPDMFSKLGESIGGQSDPLKELAGNMQQATDTDGAKNMTEALSEMAGGTDEATDKLAKFAKGAAAAGVAANAASAGQKAFSSTLGGTMNMISGLADGLFNLAKGAIGGLIATYEGILGWAQDASRAMDGVRKAMEAVRGEFGNLASNEGAAVIDMGRNLNSSMKEATGGMGIGAIAGMNYAFAMEKVKEIASALGPALNRMMTDIGDNIGSVYVMNAGLDMSAKAIAGLADQARQAGEDMTTALEETTVMVVGMSKQYGVSSKVIGKNLSALTENMGQFGHMSRKELVATATYAAKLGVEVASLNSMFDKFANFEDAATGAAKLAETFGMNVDAMALMNAESPAEQMDMMRQAFVETGRSLDDMSRQEKAYLADQMGLADTNDLYAMMDPSNADISYDDMISDAEDAAEAMSPEEAMLEAAKGIEKSIDRMMEKSKGFFDSFFQGFMDGTEHSELFREGFELIDKALREVYKIGRELGKILFAKDGPFGSEGTGAIETLKAVLGKVIGFFQILSTEIQKLASGGDNNFATFVSNMKGHVMAFFASDEIDDFGGMLLGALAKGIDFVIGGLADLMTGLVDSLKSEGENAGGPMIEGLGPGINDGLASVVDSLKSNFMALIEPLGELIGMGLSWLWTKVTDWAMEDPMRFATILLVFFPALASALMTAAFALLKPALFFALKWLGTFLLKTALPWIGSTLVSLFTSAGAIAAAKVIAIGAAIWATVLAAWQTVVNIFDIWGDDTTSLMDKIIGTIINILMLPYRAVVNLVNLITEHIFGINITEPFEDGVDAIIGAFQSMKDSVWAVITAIPEFVGGVVDDIMAFFDVGAWWDKASAAGGAILDGIMSMVGNLGEKFSEAASAAWSGFKGIFGISSPSAEAADAGTAIIDGLMGTVGELPGKFMDQLSALKDILFNLVASLIEVWLFLPTKIFEGVQMIIDKFIEFAPMIIEIVQGAFDWMVEFIGTAMDTIIDVVMFLPTKFVELVSLITSTLFDVDIAAPFKDGIDMIKGFLQDGIDFFMSMFSPSALGGIASDALDGFMSMFSIGDALSAVFGDLPGIVKKVLGISSPSKVFGDIGGNVTDGFSGSVEEMPLKMEEMMNTLIQKAVDAFTNLAAVIGDFISGFVDRVIEMPMTFIDGIQMILDAVVEFAPMISGYLGDMIDSMIEVLQSGVSFLLDIFMFMPTKMIEAVSMITDALFGIDIATPFKEGFAAVKDTIMDTITFFMETFSPAAMLQAATDIVAGFVQGFNLSDAIAEKAEQAWDSFTGFFGISSPSKLMQEAGGNISDGFAAGTESMDQALVGNTDKATALLAEVDKVSNSLNGMDAIEAESTVSKVAAGLSGDGTVTVQHEGLNIQVNFKVNIDSKDLAAALGDDAEGGPFFVINTGRGGADAGGAEAAGE